MTWDKIGLAKKGAKVILLIGLYILAIFLFLLLLSSGDVHRIREQLKDIIPIVLEINFILILIGLIINFSYIKKLFTSFSNKERYIVLALVVGAFLMSAFLPPRIHRLYYDETIYLNVAQNLAHLKKAQMSNYGIYEYGEFKCFSGEYNKQPYGYPYLVSLLFRVFGDGELPGYILNNLLFSFTALSLFLITFILFESFLAGIYAGLIYILIPQNLLWSNTTQVEPSAAFAAAFSLCLLVLYLKERKGTLLFLAFLALPFACQFRPESFLIILVFGLSILLFAPGEFGRSPIYKMGVVSFLLLIPHLAHIIAVGGETWGSKGPKFGLQYIVYNLKSNGWFYLDNFRFPLLFTLLALVGLIVGRRWRAKLVFLSWFFLFWGIFIAFYAGSYRYGADVRFSLLSYAPLAVLAGFGLYFLQNKLKERGRIKWIPLIIVIFAFSWFLPLVRATGEEAWGARMDYLYAKEFARMVPDNSLIITHNPNMFLIFGRSAAQSYLVFNNKNFVTSKLRQFRGGIYFHYNFWCNVNDPGQNKFCDYILDNLELELVKEYYERGYRYALYRVIAD
jgi:hypothetical protein